MARIRTIKPEFWTSEQIVECSPIARLLFIGMWNFCDDGGNHPASHKTLKMQIFPGDDISASQIESYISELLSNGLLSEYTAEGRKYWHVTGWRHQKIDRPSYKHPRPFDERSSNDGRGLDDGHPPEGKGREGKGMEVKAAAAREAYAATGETAEEYLARIAATQPADTRRMVVMTDDWQPCEKFEDQARISGIDPDLLTSDALAKFRIFYDGQERLANRWNLALIDWLKRERPANVADIRAAKPKPVEKKTEYWKPDPKRMMTEEELAVLHAGRALLK